MKFETQFDESFYSRQLYALGQDAIERISGADVLVVGLRGLGAEIAKNLTLAGVKSLALYDPEPATLSDLGSQFLLRLEDVGKRRASASLLRLRDLNPRVAFSELGGNSGQDPSINQLQGFQLVIVTERSLSRQIDMNSSARQNNVLFVSADSRGLFGSMFWDLGHSFQPNMHSETIKFNPMPASLKDPQFILQDDNNLTRHVGFQALWMFFEQHQHLPRPRNVADANELLHHATTLSPKELDAGLVQELAFQAVGSLAPVNSIVGGFVAHHVLNALCGNVQTTGQHVYFSFMECLPSIPPSEDDVQPISSRYDGQIAVFGQDFQRKLTNQRQLLVGSGAVGCEFLKNWAEMGLGSGSEGHIHICDAGVVQNSNLNSHVLFKAEDLGKSKAERAGNAIKHLNVDVRATTYNEAIRDRGRFDEEFFAQLDGVCTALDNRTSRLYTDSRCLLFQTPLIDAQMKGTQGSTFVSVPHLTDSYASVPVKNEHVEIVDSIFKFPNGIEATIMWAREIFARHFVHPIESAKSYIQDPSFVASQEPYGRVEIAKEIISVLATGVPSSFDDCIVWARHLFDQLFRQDIHRLLKTLPLNARTAAGELFWDAPHRRAPTTIVFDVNNTLHWNFVLAAASIHASCYAIAPSGDADRLRLIAVEVARREEIDQPQTDAAESNPAAETLPELPNPSTCTDLELHAAKFEVDDNTNCHIDFMVAAANLRATNYSIDLADRHKIKQLAGRIVPAVVTTAAVAAGLACLELYKLVDGKKDIDAFNTGEFDLSVPVLQLVAPKPTPRHKQGKLDWTPWDRIELRNDPTLADVIEWFRNEHALAVQLVSHGNRLLWSTFTPKSKAQERLAMSTSKLVETISKRHLDTTTRMLEIEVLAEDDEGEDVELPTVVVYL